MAIIDTHWSWTNLEIAALFMVPFAKKLLVPHVYSIIVFDVEFAYEPQLLLIAGQFEFGIQSAYENGIQELLLTVAQQDQEAQAVVVVVLYAKHENPDVQLVGGLQDAQYPGLVTSVVQLF